MLPISTWRGLEVLVVLYVCVVDDAMWGTRNVELTSIYIYTYIIYQINWDTVISCRINGTQAAFTSVNPNDQTMDVF